MFDDGCATGRQIAARSVRICSTAGASSRIGRRVSTVRGICPGARVERDAIFIEDGNVCTSVGVAAGIDMRMALVEQLEVNVPPSVPMR